MKQKVFVTLLAVGTLVVFALYNDLPKTSRATEDPMDSYHLYGINAGTGQLLRYDFGTSQLSDLGSITTKDGVVLTGIQASAHIPGHTNIIGFWNDPATLENKIVYVNSQTAYGAVVGEPVGYGLITSATAAPAVTGPGYNIYAVKATQDVDFVIDGGDVVPEESFATRVTVLGAAITAGGAYDAMVTAQVRVGTELIQPFGAYNLAVAGNVNDGDNPRHYVLPDIYATGTEISINGTSWLRHSGMDGTQDAHWYVIHSFNSHDNTPQIITLRDGDPVPNIPGYSGQASAVEFLRDYIDPLTDTMVLSPNQAIYLFELGTTDLSSSAADFQDLVVLVTLGKDPTALAVDTDIAQDISGVISINPNNSSSSEFRLTKIGLGTITRDDLHSGTAVDAQGVLYDGLATEVVIRPKGPGSQNTLTINGQLYTLHNNHTYTFAVPGMTAKVYNDSVNADGYPMGKWKVELTAIGASVEDTSSSSEHRLIRVDHRTGDVESVMTLTRPYEGLAATSAVTFVGTYDQGLYLIDTVAGTETLLGSTPYPQTTSMEYAGLMLISFTTDAQKLVQLNTLTGQAVGSALDMGVTDLGSLVMVARSTAPGNVAFD